MTGRGWALLAAAVVSLGTGRVLGLEDVFLIGAGMLLALAAGAAYVDLVRPRLTATRRVLPARVHAGSEPRQPFSPAVARAGGARPVRPGDPVGSIPRCAARSR